MPTGNAITTGVVVTADSDADLYMIFGVVSAVCSVTTHELGLPVTLNTNVCNTLEAVVMCVVVAVVMWPAYRVKFTPYSCAEAEANPTAIIAISNVIFFIVFPYGDVGVGVGVGVFVGVDVDEAVAVGVCVVNGVAVGLFAPLCVNSTSATPAVPPLARTLIPLAIVIPTGNAIVKFPAPVAVTQRHNTFGVDSPVSSVNTHDVPALLMFTLNVFITVGFVNVGV